MIYRGPQASRSILGSGPCLWPDLVRIRPNGSNNRHVHSINGCGLGFLLLPKILLAISLSFLRYFLSMTAYGLECTHVISSLLYRLFVVLCLVSWWFNFSLLNRTTSGFKCIPHLVMMCRNLLLSVGCQGHILRLLFHCVINIGNNTLPWVVSLKVRVFAWHYLSSGLMRLVLNMQVKYIRKRRIYVQGVNICMYTELVFFHSTLLKAPAMFRKAGIAELSLPAYPSCRHTGLVRCP